MSLRTIFVFGSNLAGRHGKGSALQAVRQYGAIRGVGVGLQGNSYAIPTKSWNLKVLPLSQIEFYVKEFLEFASHHPDWAFKVVAIGCGLAGYSPKEIAPMFKNAPSSCELPPEFVAELNGPESTSS